MPDAYKPTEDGTIIGPDREKVATVPPGERQAEFVEIIVNALNDDLAVKQGRVDSMKNKIDALSNAFSEGFKLGSGRQIVGKHRLKAAIKEVIEHGLAAMGVAGKDE